MPTCQDCGIERQWLHKHHVIPRSQGGTDASTNIVRICANCHEDRHGGPCGGTARGRLSATPEARAKKARTFKRLWQDPAYRKKLLAGRKRAWHKRDFRAIAAKCAAAWTPEMKAAQSERLKAVHKAEPERWQHANELASKRMKRRWSEDHDAINRKLLKARGHKSRKS